MCESCDTTQYGILTISVTTKRAHRGEHPTEQADPLAVVRVNNYAVVKYYYNLIITDL